jgi:hypothetical protein
MIEWRRLENDCALAEQTCGDGTAKTSSPMPCISAFEYKGWVVADPDNGQAIRSGVKLSAGLLRYSWLKAVTAGIPHLE